MIVSKTKNRLDSNMNLYNNIVDDNMLLEDYLLQLANHVKMVRTQQSQYNKAIRLARKSKIGNLNFNHSNFSITVDYVQNLALFHFSNE